MERAASQKLSPGSISRRNRCPTAVSGVTASYESCVGLRAVLFYFKQSHVGRIHVCLAHVVYPTLGAAFGTVQIAGYNCYKQRNTN